MNHGHSPTPSSPDSASISKREQNRQHTRQAILDAARHLLATRGYGNFTANEVADLAGCSRRTFFNYFPTLPAAILEPALHFNTEVRRIIVDQSADTPLFEVLLSIGSIFSSTPAAQLEAIIHMHGLAAEHPEVHRYTLQGWVEFENTLLEALSSRFRGVDPLLLHALVSAIASSARITCDELAAAVRRDPSVELGPKLLETVQRMLNIYFTGFAELFPPADPGATPKLGE